jgi:hypothetical protein
MEHIETGAALVTVPAEAPLPPLRCRDHTPHYPWHWPACLQGELS